MKAVNKEIATLKKKLAALETRKAKLVDADKK